MCTTFYRNLIADTGSLRHDKIVCRIAQKCDISYLVLRSQPGCINNENRTLTMSLGAGTLLLAEWRSDLRIAFKFTNKYVTVKLRQESNAHCCPPEPSVDLVVSYMFEAHKHIIDSAQEVYLVYQLVSQQIWILSMHQFQLHLALVELTEIFVVQRPDRVRVVHFNSKRVVLNILPLHILPSASDGAPYVERRMFQGFLK